MLDGLVDSQGEVLVGGDVIQRVPIIGQARHHVNVRIGGIDLQIAGLSTLDQDICAELALDEPLGRHDMLATERIEERAAIILPVEGGLDDHAAVAVDLLRCLPSETAVGEPVGLR